MIRVLAAEPGRIFIVSSISSVCSCHGGTRTFALQFVAHKFHVACFDQDAILEMKTRLKSIILCLMIPQVGAAYWSARYLTTMLKPAGGFC